MLQDNECPSKTCFTAIASLRAVLQCKECQYARKQGENSITTEFFVHVKRHDGGSGHYC